MVELERDLGLYATITISIGAMIGSGIFVLPGIAFDIAGPAVILAYLLAGLIVLPAALSKAEMATAIPESGGTYLYIDRAMGPLPGTVAGLGAWFSLVFKSAFALVGLSAYLLVFVDLSRDAATGIALGIAIVLVVVNIVGVEQTGRLQAAIVTLVLLVLAFFIADGLTYVDQGMYHPFFSTGASGVFAATGFVFVSYAGVTKIASVAEEVEDPGRNIPIGILASILAMMLIYTLVVFVVVGVTPPSDLTHTLRPMAVAAEQFFADGGLLVAAIAALALTSMANAGVLSSSRFPLAMSRDDLAPSSLAVVDERFSTPRNAILFTGVVLVVLIAAVPVRDLAKLASAFQILVFSIENAALVAFRESDLAWYTPEFTSPGYPWVQIFGTVAGLALLPQMGWLPIGGAAGIIVIGIAWYGLYGREKTEREGAALDAIRRRTDQRSITAIRDRLAAQDLSVMIALGGDDRLDDDSAMLATTRRLLARTGGHLTIARFSEVPDQITLSRAAGTDAADGSDPVAEGDGIAPETTVSVPVETDDLVTHEIEDAVLNYAERYRSDVIVGEWQPERFHAELLGTDVDWYMQNAPCDLVFVRDRGFDGIDTVAVVADQGPYDPLEVVIADAVATAEGATIRFVTALDEGASDEQFDAAEGYHDRLRDLTRARAEYAITRSSDRRDALYRMSADADLAVVGTSAHHVLYDVVFGAIPDRLAEDLSCTVVLVHSQRSRRSTLLRYLLERLAF